LSAVPASWLRAAWALAAFVPLAILATPIFAYQIGIVFLLCAMYLWPASWVAQQIGITPLTPQYAVVAAVYCAGLGWTVASIVSRVLRLPAHVERRRAIVLVTVVWLPIFAFAGFQFLDYKGVASNATQCPGHMYALQPHCKDISDFREHELAGFIDRTFVATLRLRPGALPDIVAANQMKEISPADVPAAFWSLPPFWWTIRPQAAARIYMTPAFSFEGRGRDGDHYLFIEDRLTNDVFVYFQNNF
jgi:hypothetical protein